MKLACDIQCEQDNSSKASKTYVKCNDFIVHAATATVAVADADVMMMVMRIVDKMILI